MAKRIGVDEAKVARIQREAAVLRAIKFGPQPAAAIIETTKLTQVQVFDALKKLALEGEITACKVVHDGENVVAYGLSVRSTKA